MADWYTLYRVCSPNIWHDSEGFSTHIGLLCIEQGLNVDLIYGMTLKVSVSTHIGLLCIGQGLNGDPIYDMTLKVSTHIGLLCIGQGLNGTQYMT